MYRRKNIFIPPGFYEQCAEPFSGKRHGLRATVWQLRYLQATRRLVTTALRSQTGGLSKQHAHTHTKKFKTFLLPPHPYPRRVHWHPSLGSIFVAVLVFSRLVKDGDAHAAVGIHCATGECKI